MLTRSRRPVLGALSARSFMLNLKKAQEKAEIISSCTLARISRADCRAFGCIIPILTVKPNLQPRSRFLQMKVCIFYCLRMTSAVDFEVIEIGKADLGQ
jgi:hypothetical protein